MASEKGTPQASSWAERKYLSTHIAAGVLGLSRAAVYALERAGDLQFVRLGGRTMVRTETILRLLENPEPWTPRKRRRPSITAAA